MRVFAISDIHGCAKTFIALIEEVIKLEKEDKLFLLGDYIDRGPDSKGVIDFIIQLKYKGFDVTALRGNHEEMLLKGIEDASFLEMFLKNGGDKTLQGFGVRHPKDLPNEYLTFFNQLGFYSRFENFILVHAGINTNAIDPFEDKESMLWTRRFTVDRMIKDNFVIHGHTPKPIMDIQTSLLELKEKKKVDIDNGCVFASSRAFMGNLCCLELKSLRLHFQPYID